MRNVSRIKVMISTVPGFSHCMPSSVVLYLTCTLVSSKSSLLSILPSVPDVQRIEIEFFFRPPEGPLITQQARKQEIWKVSCMSGKFDCFSPTLKHLRLKVSASSLRPMRICNSSRNSSDHPHTSWLRHFGLL